MADGIRFKTADLSSLVRLLNQDRYTRQAYLPIWFPEDLSAALLNERVPCTLGWHFMVRNHDGVDRLHLMYPMRSTDAVRHFHNDVYMANALALWVIDQLDGPSVEPGELTMTMSSFHCFENDRYALGLAIKKELN
jgi:thymidylate synthase